jgi:hypothetical protein
MVWYMHDVIHKATKDRSSNGSSNMQLTEGEVPLILWFCMLQPD